uniref:alpha/beta fold hydrolase n=1 Tax=uncultured Allobacillus sp. TaxID=1638025 RepID=UPI002593ED7C|nr:alpha/beta fold hydrolase [uncultured Allobacillus sp.]
MYQVDPILKQILDMHRAQAEDIIQRTASMRVRDAFVSCWNYFNNGSISASVSGDKIRFDADEIIQTIDKWIKDFEVCKEAEIAKLYRMEDPSYQDRSRVINIQNDIDHHIRYIYQMLKGKITQIDIEFSNAARAYRSPIHQALNDMNRLYSEMNDIKGPFSGFKDVSVYIHGIEDNGDSFLDSAKKVANIGDVLIYENRDGDISYHLVTEEGILGPEVIKSIDDLKNNKEFSKDARLHLIYETEYKNEHRQKTSDDLTDKLIEMGLLNEETKLNMFAHSYGGRRSFQFAMDYPENVSSITTIGTPYDENLLSGLANTFPTIAGFMNKVSDEYSDYLDFNTLNTTTNNQIKFSNAYTDMTSEEMKEDVKNLKSANPEIYSQLDDMEITAVAGRDFYERPSGRLGTSTVKYYDSHDGAVSITSQHAESLGSLIDQRPTYAIEGESITNPAHSNEIESEEFIELIRKVNLSK